MKVVIERKEPQYCLRLTPENDEDEYMLWQMVQDKLCVSYTLRNKKVAEVLVKVGTTT